MNFVKIVQLHKQPGSDPTNSVKVACLHKQFQGVIPVRGPSDWVDSSQYPEKQIPRLRTPQ